MSDDLNGHRKTDPDREVIGTLTPELVREAVREFVDVSARFEQIRGEYGLSWSNISDACHAESRLRNAAAEILSIRNARKRLQLTTQMVMFIEAARQQRDQIPCERSAFEDWMKVNLVLAKITLTNEQFEQLSTQLFPHARNNKKLSQQELRHAFSDLRIGQGDGALKLAHNALYKVRKERPGAIKSDQQFVRTWDDKRLECVLIIRYLLEFVYDVPKPIVDDVMIAWDESWKNWNLKNRGESPHTSG